MEKREENRVGEAAPEVGHVEFEDPEVVEGEDEGVVDARAGTRVARVVLGRCWWHCDRDAVR